MVGIIVLLVDGKVVTERIVGVIDAQRAELRDVMSIALRTAMRAVVWTAVANVGRHRATRGDARRCDQRGVVVTDKSLVATVGPTLCRIVDRNDAKLQALCDICQHCYSPLWMVRSPASNGASSS